MTVTSQSGATGSPSGQRVRAPAGVWLVVGVMAAYYLAGLPLVRHLASTLGTPDRTFGPVGLNPEIWAASHVWGVAWGGLLPWWLLRRRNWAWSASAAALFARIATATATLAMLLYPGPQRIPFAMLALACSYIALHAGLLAALFGCRGWFGIGRREGWRRLLQKGWWILFPTAALDGLFLANLVNVLREM